jgi:hypothetical protein
MNPTTLPVDLGLLVIANLCVRLFQRPLEYLLVKPENPLHDSIMQLLVVVLGITLVFSKPFLPVDMIELGAGTGLAALGLATVHKPTA